jgi:uncharacterized membrane protein YbhN (UPF0104 family)
VKCPRHGHRGLLKGALALVALAIVCRAGGSVHVDQAAAMVVRSGAWVAVGLLPYAVALALDALAWQHLLKPVTLAPLALLVRVRLRCDAFGATVPGGTLVGESIAPAWLRASMPLEVGVAAVAARKCVVGAAEGLYLVASGIAAFSVMATRSRAVPWIVLALGLAMLALFVSVGLALRSGAIAGRLHRRLASIPVGPLRGWIAPAARAFADTDERLASILRGSPGRLALACLLSLLAWTVESVESWLLLRLVGVTLPLHTVIAFEASASLLRSIGAFSPGGLGVQDAGYIAALGALGMPEAITAGAAFLVLKRGKDLVWAVAGYASLLLAGSRPPSPIGCALPGATLEGARP